MAAEKFHQEGAGVSLMVTPVLVLRFGDYEHGCQRAQGDLGL